MRHLQAAATITLLSQTCCLLVPCSALSSTSVSLQCDTQDMDDCRTVAAASLLQVQSTQLKVSKEDSAAHMPQTRVVDLDEPADVPGQDSFASPKELKKDLGSLQSQIDDIKDRVAAVEKTKSIASKSSKSSDSANNDQDTDSGKPAAGDNAAKTSGKKGSRGQADSKGEGGGKYHNDDWAWPKSSGSSLSSDSEKKDLVSDKDYPDWNGVAPGPHWNGLEDVKATDKGPEASWKNGGTGVVTGEKYLGNFPYDPLMDLDYLIDSNPKLKVSEQRKEQESRRRRKSKMKRSPKAGGKESAAGEKTQKEASNDKAKKKAPVQKGKTNGRVSKAPSEKGKSTSKNKKAPRTSGKSAAKA